MTQKNEYETQPDKISEICSSCQSVIQIIKAHGEELKVETKEGGRS